MAERTAWRRANTLRYRSRESCQRAADWLNRQFRFGGWWHEPVIAADGSCWEMWRAPRDEAWEGSYAAP